MASLDSVDSAALWARYQALPEAAQEHLLALMELLARPAARARRPATRTHPPLADEPFVGMWADRDDMQDSSRWVRDLRSREWSRGDA